MGELLTFSQSSLLLLPKIQLQYHKRGWNPTAYYLVSPLANSPLHSLATKSILSPTPSIQKKQFWGISASVISDSKMPTTFTADSAGGGVDVLPDTGGGAGDDFGNASGGNGGGGSGGGGGNGGGDGNNDKNDGEGESGESNDENVGSGKKKTGMSMSQKITLGYAVLVGAGGLMGFLKSGSQKSLISGGTIALTLCFVYNLLPKYPAVASAMGLGTSIGLLIVMGSRFKMSGKIFPAGVVSFASLFMIGGYLHGLMRML